MQIKEHSITWLKKLLLNGVIGDENIKKMDKMKRDFKTDQVIDDTQNVIQLFQ